MIDFRGGGRYNSAVASEGLFFIEPFTEDFLRLFKVDKVLFEGKTKFQFVQCLHNRVFGKLLFLDRRIQSAEIDEFIFHETLVQPALFSHPSPQNVLIIGGGEGATLREVLRHSTVRKAVMLDIDRELVEICRTILPEWSAGAFSDSRSKLLFGDGRKYIKQTMDRFDVIIADLTEPLEEGPSVYLFTREFFEYIHRALGEDGIFVLQAGSADPHYHNFFASCSKTLSGVFSVVRPFWTFMFSFSLPWGFILASKKQDPLKISEEDVRRRMRNRGIKKLKFYHPGLHASLFSLPLFLSRAIKKGRVLTDERPYIWKA